MAVNTQFTIAVHIMAALGYLDHTEVTSSDLAMSVNTSASFVRRILSRLAKAGLVSTTTGKGGTCKLARPAKKISLVEIYQAVGAPKVFAIHKYPELKVCPVSCGIKSSLERVLDKSQISVEKTLAGITLADVIGDFSAG